MSDDAQREFREVQAFFRLPSVSLVEKDVHVVRAIQAVATVDADPFTLIFGGGTALARAHKIVRRMSEDVDFKIVAPATPVSRNMLRQKLGTLRDRVTAALKAAGFAFDQDAIKSRNESRYTVYQLPYCARAIVHTCAKSGWPLSRLLAWSQCDRPWRRDQSRHEPSQ